MVEMASDAQVLGATNKRLSEILSSPVFRIRNSMTT